MGYRSNVRIILKKEDYEDFVKALENKGYKFKDIFTDSAECIYDENYSWLSADYVKWYNEYEEVKFVMEFIRNLDFYYYARIGEDLDDVEEEASEPFYVDYDGEYPIIRTFTDVL